MRKIQILDSGILFNLKGKDITTPCILEVDQKDLDLIDSILKSKGASKYSLLNVSDISSLGEYSVNCRKDLYDKRDYKFKDLLASSPNLESIGGVQSVDYTNEMSPVKNQGHLGSCVSFGITAVKEWQEQKEHDAEVKAGKKYLREEKYYDLSEQWLYYKTKAIDPWGEKVEGTSIRYALQILQKIGIPNEKGWKYNDSLKGKPESWANLISRWGKCGDYYRISNTKIVDNLKSALANFGPLPFSMYCFKDFYSVGKDGIVPFPTNELNYIGGHCMCMVGFTENNLFKFKNSWGTNWGQKGYGYISSEYVEKYLTDVWVIPDISVKRNMLKNQ